MAYNKSGASNNWIGKRLKGEYTIERELGKGGFGVAYLAKRIHENTSVAIKVLQRSTQEEVLNFSKEAFRTLQLQHEHIVPIYDLDDEEGSPYFVMAFALEGSLRNELQRKNGIVSVDYTMFVITQATLGIQYAHNKRFVHQDIKPDNLLLPTKDHIWVSDFGIAKKLKPVDSLQPMPTPFSPHYASPEQLKGKSEKASDQYSLAVIAFEMLTGRRPFEGNQAFIIARQHYRP